jgi:hypothetical protein
VWCDVGRAFHAAHAPEPTWVPAGMSTQRKGQHDGFEEVPAEEDLSLADAEDRIDVDPDEQVNRTDSPGPRDARTDVAPPAQQE